MLPTPDEVLAAADRLRSVIERTPLIHSPALSERAAATEVDRYLAWPGQALAYKLGQLELLDLRRRAAQHLGGRFDVRRYHDIVLGHGSLPLAVVRQIVEGELGRDRSGAEHTALMFRGGQCRT